MSVEAARLELLMLDAIKGRGGGVTSSVAKAVTMALLHGGVETKIMCRTTSEAIEAHMLMNGKTAESVGLTWNDAEEVYELKNGSAVSVVIDFPDGKPWIKI